jgi:signal transduction histidine kinase
VPATRALWTLNRACAFRNLFRALWIGSIVFTAGVLPVCSETRRVILLFDERPELPGLAALDAEFVQALSPPPGDKIEIYREEMDASRFGSERYRSLLRNFLTAKYADTKIDLIVTVMGGALNFVLGEAPSSEGPFLPGTPIVFCGVDAQNLSGRTLPPHVRGISVKRVFAPTLEIALRFQPTPQRVVVVGGTSAFDARLLEDARQEFRAYENLVSFTYLTNLAFDRLLAEVAQLPPRTIVMYTSLFQDGAGEAFVPHDAVARISAAASVPVYGFVDQYIGRGIVGGSLYSLAAQGTQAARLASDVLSGRQSQPALSEIASSRLVFDWRQMKRWNIAPGELPPGSEIRFRDTQIWEQYPWETAAAASVLFVQAGFIFLLLHERSRRRSAEVEARQRLHELAHIGRQATAGEMSASIAHELNQPLGAILNNVETAAIILDSPSPDIAEVKAILNDVRRDDVRASEVIRRLRSLLKHRPFVTGQVDLNEVVGEVISLCRASAAAAQIRIERQPGPSDLRVEGDPIQLQQVVLNLIMNAIEATEGKRAREITCNSWKDGTSAVISVRDHGLGIPEEKLEQIFKSFVTSKEQGMGMGLSIARTIVEAHGGSIWAENAPGGGAVFRVRLPLVDGPRE